MSSLGEQAVRSPHRRVTALPKPPAQPAFLAQPALLAQPVRLPHPLTRLIGREREIAAIVARIQQPGVRLVTFSGPPGVGKTRLAIAAAQRLVPSFPDGVFFVPLASVSDPTLVSMAIAQELGVRTVAGRTVEQTLRDELAGRAMLIVLDNFEQLLPARPAIVGLLSHCAELTMLVTSRVTLHVSGEHEIAIAPLELPDLAVPPAPTELEASAAVALFVDRVRAFRPGFNLDADAAAVAEICHLLDGLPLAIELAAARLKVFTPVALRDRLAVAGDLLRDGPVDLPPHQRSVRDTIAWSYDLLDAAEQQIFRSLSIFAGGFMAHAMAFVCGDEAALDIRLPDDYATDGQGALEACISLADKSLIFKTTDVRGEPRFSMLLTLRGFGHAELRKHIEWEQTGARHASWYLALAWAASAAHRGAEQEAWLDWLQIELANLRAALNWFRERQEMASCAAMTRALGTFWLVRGHLVEGLRWLQLVLADDAASTIDNRLRVDLLCTAGWLALRQGLPELARDYAEESIAGARRDGTPLQLAAALRLLGDIEDRIADYARARELMREALVLYENGGDAVGVADTLTGLAGIAMDTGDYREAERLFRQAVEAATATGNVIILARAMDALSATLSVQGKFADALAHAERALDLYRAHGNVRGTAIAMDHVGKCSRSLGDLERAWSCHRDSLVFRRQVGDPRGMAVWLEAVAALLASCDAFASAARVLGAVDAMRRRGGFPIHTHETAQLEQTVRRTRASQSPEHFARNWSRGAAMSLTDIVDFALDEAERAVAARGAERLDEPPSGADDALARYGLTARERDVLQLLMVRLSDKEIADQLSISPRTVGRHVTNILAKLGVHSRHKAAALVAAGDQQTSDPPPTPPTG